MIRNKKVISLILAACVTTCVANNDLSFMGNAKPVLVEAKKTGRVTASSLNVRTGAGKKYSILKYKGKNIVLPNGSKVNILNEKKGWYSVSFNYNNTTLNGYVSGDYIEPSESMDISLKIPAKVKAAFILKKSASYNAKDYKINNKSLKLKKGTEIKILKEIITNKEKWYKISYKYEDSTIKGYIPGDFTKLVFDEYISGKVNSDNKIKVLNDAYDLKSYLINENGENISLNLDDEVIITKELTIDSEKWYKVKFTYKDSQMKGYILADNITLLGIYEEPEIPEPSIPEPSTPEPSEPQPSTPEPSTPEPSTPEPSTPEPSTPEPSTPEPSTPEPSEPQPSTPEQDSNLVKMGVVVNTNYLNVRTGAGTFNSKVNLNGKDVTLSSGEKVYILAEELVGETTWYRITFKLDGAQIVGYVSSLYMNLQYVDTTPAEEKYETLNDEEFAQMLIDEGFPQSYWEPLTQLHKEHPFWQFKAYHTGIDWNTAVIKESVVGKNLITNSKNIAWKSTDSKAYDWYNDRFIAFDGSTWVAVSPEAVAYYMDPRNFLTENYIYQFEQLAYNEKYQSKEGIESILFGTPMYYTEYNYIDDITNISKNITYSDTFLDAAKYSGVSPYHLASRSKQEVITSSKTFSGSASGKFSGYEGYYNFYNIGATHSTQKGGAISNGLRFAKVGSSSLSLNNLYMIPWNSQYKSIVGGAYYIGSSYINRGQDTIYLQKFNVTNTQTYNHQYMANIEAPYAESAKTAAAYASMEAVPIVFSIPVYENMTSTKTPPPIEVKNFNNWLSSLEVDNYKFDQDFDSANEEYTLTVKNNVDKVNIKAVAVSKYSTVNGTGEVLLAEGENKFEVRVTAENGDIKVYTIVITRKVEKDDIDTEDTIDNIDIKEDEKNKDNVDETEKDTTNINKKDKNTTNKDSIDETEKENIDTKEETTNDDATRTFNTLEEAQKYAKKLIKQKEQEINDESNNNNEQENQISDEDNINNEQEINRESNNNEQEINDESNNNNEQENQISDENKEQQEINDESDVNNDQQNNIETDDINKDSE